MIQPKPSLSETGDPLLLTPGPLTTSLSVKRAMLHDYGSRDHEFLKLNQEILERLLQIVNGKSTHVAVPLQGSGTYVVEAMLGCFVPRNGKLLICSNGAYGKRMEKICQYHGRLHTVIEFAENEPVAPREVDLALKKDSTLTHVAVVHSETTSGILNPLDEIAEVVARHGRGLLVDSMSALGAVPVDASQIPFDALCASSNKCLEGVPGVGFCLARQEALINTMGNCPSLSLDLYDQWQAMQTNQQWRFTPPTHVILALHQALDELDREGGVNGRGARYRSNCTVLVEGMRAMGFRTLLPDALQAPNIVTFHMPTDEKFVFAHFYDLMRTQGFVIYPGKLTVLDSFRIGCIGRLHEGDMRRALTAVRYALNCLGCEGSLGQV